MTNHAAYTPKKTTPQITSSAGGSGLEGPLTRKATIPARATMGKRAIRTSARRKIVPESLPRGPFPTLANRLDRPGPRSLGLVHAVERLLRPVVVHCEDPTGRDLEVG